MEQHGDEQPLDVLRVDVLASVEQRPGPHRAVEGERAAHRAAGRHLVELPGGAHQPHDPLPDQRVDVHLLHGALELLDFSQRDRGAEVAERMAAHLFLDDPKLLVLVWIAEGGADEEAVELRLREQERPFLLDRVLRRDQEEGAGEMARCAVDGDLELRHRLEQRGLRLRHRAVDLVDEDDVGEDGAGPELEVARLLVEDREAGHVGRLQIGCALDPCGARSVDALRERAGEHRLGGSRHVLEEDVAVARECGQDERHLAALAAHHGGDVVQQPLERGRRVLDPVGPRWTGDEGKRRDGLGLGHDDLDAPVGALETKIGM